MKLELEENGARAVARWSAVASTVTGARAIAEDRLDQRREEDELGPSKTVSQLEDVQSRMKSLRETVG